MLGTVSELAMRRTETYHGQQLLSQNCNTLSTFKVEMSFDKCIYNLEYC